MLGIDTKIASIPVGESATVKGTYTVTQTDIDNGGVIRNVAIVGEGEDKQEPDVETPVEQNPSLSLYKEVTSGNKEYALGEEITYKVTVTNTGNTTQSNIVVTDTNSEEGTATVEGNLVPGAKGSVTFTHIVDEDDLKAGKVVNVATVGDEESNPVTTPVKVEEPSLQLTKTALKDGKPVRNIEYNPDENNTFTYRLKVENTVENSYPAIVEDEQTVTDTLPEGITVVDRRNLPDGVEVNEVNGREVITWTVSNIGYEANAKYVDINVKIDETVFENQRVDAGDETTVLDVKFSQDGKPDIPHNKTDRTGKAMNLFLRTAGATNKNDGYIYAGTVTANKTVNESVFASSTYNNDTKVNNALTNSYQLEDMLDDFVTANEDGTMAQYVSGGLPTKADVNQALRELYGGTVTLSDTQVVLWYKVVKNADSELERYYRITDDGKDLFGEQGDYVELSACTYHLDGIIVDVSDLGTMIPTGAQVDVLNTAQLKGVSGANGTSTATVSIHYKNIDTSRSGVLTTNLLSSALESIENETINSENVEQIAEKAEEADKKNNTPVTENVIEETKQDNTSAEETTKTETETDNRKEEITTEGNTSEEETTIQPQEPVSEEKDDGKEITASDDINKNTTVPTTQSVVDNQEVKTE